MDDRATANRLLDRLKDGEKFSRLDVNRALRDAGDIEADGCEGMDQAVSEEGDGGRESRSISMVAENLIRLSEKAWAESRRRLAETNEQ
ncbi:hypothetical protein UFOVP188_13 [uncultured Caudovirales phage]|uniref:Uncharacterized protein n=1 Tax=uncultured Caudovirales phage TaxID=2100421 RepID=A0A6J7WIJ1_9CAUD|nr:hypothetical protein UFOVP188_13 [uncultured Caudovirales phage]